jgi:hypothetical protein
LIGFHHTATPGACALQGAQLKHGSFEAWIEIEGNRAHEYRVTGAFGDDGTSVVTAWIASEEGKVRVQRSFCSGSIR